MASSSSGFDSCNWVGKLVCQVVKEKQGDDVSPICLNGIQQAKLNILCCWGGGGEYD